MAATGSRRWLVSLAAVLVAAGSMLAVMYWLGLRSNDLLVRRYAGELEHLEGHLLEEKLRSLANLSEQGQRVVVQALGSERRELQQAADHVLHEQLAHWRIYKLEYSLPRVAQLARQLASEVDRFPPEGRRAAADLARQILRWPLDPRHRASIDLLADCETLIKAAPPWQSLEPLERESPLLAGDLPEASSIVSASVSDSDDLPETAGEDSEAPAVESTAKGEPTPASPPNPLSEPRKLTDDAGPLAPVPAEPLATSELQPVEELSLKPLHAQPGSASSPRDGSTPEPIHGRRYDQLTEVELMQLLMSPQLDEASWAEAQLRSRGYTDTHIALARKLADPDPLVRQQLAEQLPSVPGIDARPWLLWLSRDPDARVRLAAITVIATSSDPKLMDELRKRQAEESDPVVLGRIRSIVESMRR